MDPKRRARVDASIGGLTFALSLLRGKATAEAQADARTAVAFTGPLVEELEPHVTRLWREREAKRAAAQAAAEAPRCGMRAGIFCVLARGHASVVNPWHQDEHGALFQGDE